MRSRWILVVASTVAVAAVLLASACGGGQSLPTSSSTSAATTTSTTTAATTTTTQAASTTRQSPSTTTSLTASTTTTAPSTTTSSAASTTPQIIPGVPPVRYANSKYKFFLYRPKSSTLKTQGFAAFLPLTKTPVVAIVLPQSLFKGTNLIEAGVYIGASTSLAVVPKWDVPVAGSTEVSAGTTTINGTSFAIFTSTRNAAGNVYEERVYRTLSHNFCLEVVELLHYGDLGNYSSGSVVQFDKVKFQGYLEAIVDTLTLAP